MQTPVDVVELLQLLVRTPSVNPAGEPGTDHVGEARCAEVIAEFLRKCGADEVWMQEVKPDRPNVIARFRSDAPGKKRLVLAPHTDTVGVCGMTVEPFGGELRDGRIYGRGSSDTKGSIAAILWALYELRGKIAGLGHEIWFTGLMGEETGCDGSRAWTKEYTADFAVIGEPTSLDIVHAHKGTIRLKAVTHGKACHSSAPGDGENAIYKMTNVIRCVQEEIAPWLASKAHPILGAPTVCVTTCHGGVRSNIVPDRCVTEIDVRIVPGQTGLGPEIVEKLRKAEPGLEVETAVTNPLFTEPNHPIIHQLEKTGGKCTGAPWYCDAAIFSEAGIPAVAVGPGSIDQAHTKDEWIKVADLRRGVEFYQSFLSAI